MISIDFEMRAVILSPEYMKSMVLFECSSWSFRSFVEQHPVFSLNNDEARLFKQYYNLLYEKLTGTPRKHQKELFDALLEMFHYDFMIQWNVSIMKIQKHFLLLKCCLGIFLNC